MLQCVQDADERYPSGVNPGRPYTASPLGGRPVSAAPGDAQGAMQDSVSTAGLGAAPAGFLATFSPRETC